jgi:hypothetical protein
MTRYRFNTAIILVVAVLFVVATPADAGQPQSRIRPGDGIASDWTLAQINNWLKHQKDVIELADTSIIIEVNSTDGDAGFQIFLDGNGWKNARVFGPDGHKVLQVTALGGVRAIGGGTELFMETSEPEYDDLEGMQDLIELLPEGEYFFLARTTEDHWATGTADLTHDVPAGPEIVYPVPSENEDECSTGVFVDSAYVEWDPVETDIWGDPEIEIEAYQVIVASEAEDGPDLEYMVVVPAETTMVTIPEEALAEGVEFKFEILAIEESGNQTITESCFETEE